MQWGVFQRFLRKNHEYLCAKFAFCAMMHPMGDAAAAAGRWLPLSALRKTPRHTFGEECKIRKTKGCDIMEIATKARYGERAESARKLRAAGREIGRRRRKWRAKRNRSKKQRNRSEKFCAMLRKSAKSVGKQPQKYAKSVESGHGHWRLGLKQKEK